MTGGPVSAGNPVGDGDEDHLGDRERQREFLRELGHFYHNGKFLDVRLVGGDGEEVPAQKLVLVAVSQVLREAIADVDTG